MAVHIYMKVISLSIHLKHILQYEENVKIHTLLVLKGGQGTLTRWYLNSPCARTWRPFSDVVILEPESNSERKEL